MNRWMWLASGMLLGADWLRRSLRTAFGMGKLADVTSPEWDRLPRREGAQPSIAVVVPARNEGGTIEQCLLSLLAQDYPNLQILAVDDRSTDATGSVMERIQARSSGKLRVVHVSELPPG